MPGKVDSQRLGTGQCRCLDVDNGGAHVEDHLAGVGMTFVRLQHRDDVPRPAPGNGMQ